MNKKKLYTAVLWLGILSIIGIGMNSSFAAEVYRPQVVAHRGASGYLPEHTLEAKAMGYGLGSDYLEQDVVMTKDGQLVVLHDLLLDTTTNVAEVFPDRARDDGRYYVTDFTLDELRTLRLTERFDHETKKPVFSGRFPDSPISYRIHTLEEEFYQLVGLNKSTGRNVKASVEVKEQQWFMDQGYDPLKATIEVMDKFGFNDPKSGVILQTFDYDSVVRARTELGWKGELLMSVSPNGQAHKKGDKERMAWLQTPEGIKEVSKYATIYSPWLSLMAVPNANGKGYKMSNIADLARKNGMEVHTWTLRRDSLDKGFNNFNEVLDVCFKELKVDAVVTDFPDVVIDYLEKNGMR